MVQTCLWLKQKHVHFIFISGYYINFHFGIFTVSVHAQKMSMQKCIAGNEETQQITFNTKLEIQITVYSLEKKSYV